MQTIPNRDLIIMLTYFLDKLNQPRQHKIYTTCTAILWSVVRDVFLTRNETLWQDLLTIDNKLPLHDWNYLPLTGSILKTTYKNLIILLFYLTKIKVKTLVQLMKSMSLPLPSNSYFAAFKKKKKQVKGWWILCLLFICQVNITYLVELVVAQARIQLH